MSGNQKVAWLGVVDVHEDNHVDLHPSLAGSMQESFQSMLCDRAVFENVPPSSYSPNLPGACCLEVSGGSLWRSYGERVNKAFVMGCAMLAGLQKAWENGCCFSWTTWPWFWVLRRVVVACQTSTTLVAKFVSSVSPRSSSPSADGLRQKIFRPMSHLAPSVTARACTPMLTNVGRLQRGQPLTRSCLPSSQPKPHELPVKRRKLESNRQVGPALVSPTKIEEGWKQVRRRREERRRARARAHLSAAGMSASPLRRVVLPRAEPSHRSHGPTLHGHAQRVRDLCKNVAGRADVTGKVGRDGGGDAGTHVLSQGTVTELEIT